MSRKLGLFACCILAAGCAGGSSSPAPVAATGLDAGLASEATSMPTPECVAGDVKPCSCDNLSDAGGQRPCIGGHFGICMGCVVQGEVSRCVAGHYEGTFEMTYTPGPAGVCGLATLFGGSGSGNFAFDLEASGSQEFFTVGNGCVHAQSDSVDAGLVQLGAELFAKGVPMSAILTGAVDCTTGELQGELRGTYHSTSVCGLGLAEDDFFFKGPFTGTYDPATQSFPQGTLTLHEPPVSVPLAGEPGGSGTWSATLRASDADAGVESYGDGGDCLGGVVFQDFELPDAGEDDGGM